jgi:chorismate mutase
LNQLFNERQALMEFISYVKEERSRLLEEYLQAMQRLQKLDNLERMASTDLDTETMEKIIATASKYTQSQSTNEVTEQEEKSTGEPTNDSSKQMTLEEEINHFNKKRFGDEYNPEEKAEEHIHRFTSKKEAYLDKDHNKTHVTKVPTKGGHYNDVKKIALEVGSMLKEAGKPLKTSEIIKRLRDNGHRVNSPYSMLDRIKHYNKNVTRVSHGYYQYQQQQ